MAAFDSQLKWCARIHRELESRGFACRVVVPGIRAALSAQQIADAGVASVETMGWEEMIAESLEADVVVSGLSGPLTKRLSVELSAVVPRQSPLARRKLKHGPVKGTLSHVAYNGLPPVVRRPLKRWAKDHRLFRATPNGRRPLFPRRGGGEGTAPVR
ncbi:DUF6716 putative glycosyltransferase [Streptomyces koyangensis]|uniref:DUF6716 putative glycosyltransferase n=1 Tax=Streptomyces koyangensis TaxID=188770 RepID=UPI003C2BF9EF